MITIFAASGPRNTTVLATLMDVRGGRCSKKRRPGRYEDRLLSYLTFEKFTGWLAEDLKEEVVPLEFSEGRLDGSWHTGGGGEGRGTDGRDCDRSLREAVHVELPISRPLASPGPNGFALVMPRAIRCFVGHGSSKGRAFLSFAAMVACCVRKLCGCSCS